MSNSFLLPTSRRNLAFSMLTTILLSASTYQAAFADGPPSEIRGQVLLPNGEPAANVSVIAYWLDIFAKTQTDEKGVFQLELDPEEVIRKTGLTSWRRGAVVALADGYGPAWELLGEVKQKQSVKLTLVEDQPVRGRVLDQQGRPVVGAEVHVLWLHDEDGNLEGFLGATRDTPTNTGLQTYTKRKMKYLSPSLIAWNHNKTEEMPEFRVTTDQNGRFELRGCGRQRSLHVRFSGPGIASQNVFVVTAPTIDARWKRTSLSRETKLYLQSGATIPPVFPAEFSLLAEPGLTIRGTLRDSKSGKPIPGMNVLANVRGSSSQGFFKDTAADGKYEINGLAIEGKLRISALNPGNAAYIDAKKEINVTGDNPPESIDFKLDRGVLVTGKVTDTEGNPVKGNVGYLTWRGNRLLEELSEPYDTFNTQSPNEVGDYAIVVPAGVGVLTFTAREREHFQPAIDDDFGLPVQQNRGPQAFFSSGNRGLVMARHFTVLRRIEPSKNQTELKVDLVADAGDPVIGTLTTSEGDAVAKFTASGLSKGGNSGSNDGKFRVRGLQDKEQRQVFFRSEDQKWAVIKSFSHEDTSEKQIVRLLPTATISLRVTDKRGKPLSDWLVGAGSEGMIETITGKGNNRGAETFRFDMGTTDADGFVHLKGIPANVQVEILAGKQSNNERLQPLLVKSVMLRPGQKLELDEVRLPNVDEADE